MEKLIFALIHLFGLLSFSYGILEKDIYWMIFGSYILLSAEIRNI